ncbi:hypothetical protein CO725_13670 [Vibrio parahaemolyticus]|uniref:recombinase family protein n=1 Tax=Vibrio parahaemolyticus TaxID=670 RepID=UPI000BE2A5A7|nr:recombinase family protein [Vibrio parahaemolyticus]ATI46680.1 hypothetical protein CO725_13670 [Vibrio parahaemolyticus]
MDKVIYPYVRFSTKKQEHGHSLSRQITRIKEYAIENGYKVNDSLELRDLGKSGFRGLNAKEGALSVFLRLLEEDKIPKDGSSYLCIEQFDRLSRMPAGDAYEVFRKILKQNVNIITLMDRKVYRKEDLNNMVSILSSLLIMEQAHIESQRKSDLISAVFKDKVKTLKSGGKVQFTYILPGWIDNNGTKKDPDFVLNEKVETVKMIIDMYLGGETMGHIARILNEKQVPQIARKKTKNRTNSWNSAKISHLLTNQTLLGKLYIRTTGDVIEDYYPAVITKDEWDLIQAKKRTQNSTKVAGRRSINIFQGRLFCADCGNKYYFETDDKKGKGGKRYIYHMLKCSGRRFHSCNSESLKYDDFTNPDLFFFRDIGEVDSDDILLVKKEIRDYEKEVESLKLEQSEIEDMFENDEINLRAYSLSISKVTDKIDDIEAKIVLNKQHLSFSSNEYRMEEFDKNNPESVSKAKNFIRKNYAGIIISSEYNIIIALMHSGEMSIRPLPRPYKYPDPIKGYPLLQKIKDNIQEQDRKGLLDGKFKELLDAFNFSDRYV